MTRNTLLFALYGNVCAYYAHRMFYSLCRGNFPSLRVWTNLSATTYCVDLAQILGVEMHTSKNYDQSLLQL